MLEYKSRHFAVDISTCIILEYICSGYGFAPGRRQAIRHVGGIREDEYTVEERQRISYTKGN